MVPDDAVHRDELLRRHTELALRLHDGGYPIAAMDTALGVLSFRPPRRDLALLQFLVQTVLARAARGDSPADEAVRQYLAWHGETRQELAWWTRYFLFGDRGSEAAARGRGAVAAELRAALALVEAQPPGDLPPPDVELPPGCVPCVVVRGPQGWLTRLHVRFSQPDIRDDRRIVGLDVPGRAAAVHAAQRYLAEAGCEAIDPLQAEVLVEGAFGRIEGESLSLAVFVAAVSARVGMPVSRGWALTGAIGEPSEGSPSAPVIPVDKLEAKLAACARGGCRRLMVSAHQLPGSAAGIRQEGCKLEAVVNTVEALERALPRHHFPAEPQPVGLGGYLGGLVRAAVSWPSTQTARTPAPPHRLYRLLVPLFFALMLTERWFLADYVISEHYQGVERPGAWLAAGLGVLASLLLAGLLYASLRVVDDLMDRDRAANWALVAGVLLAGHVVAWLIVQPVIRDPFAPPPRGLFLEHRTFQWIKDTIVLFAYSVVFFVTPYTRVRMAERAAEAGRLRWAAEILEGRRWKYATTRAASTRELITIAAVAIAVLGGLDWLGLLMPGRAGQGPWRTLHVIGRANLYLLSCAVALWWIWQAGPQIERRRRALAA